MDKILLFIPMYNCQNQIKRVLSQVDEELCEYVSEVIVVNNRSTDDSENAALEAAAQNKVDIPIKVLRNKDNYGLGGSHKVAFNYAFDNGFDYVIVLHGDDQGSVKDILPHIKSGEYKKHDCILGARFMKESSLPGYSGFRIFGNKVFNFLFSVVAGRKVYDLGSGLNMYKTSMLKDRFYVKYKDNLVFNCYMIIGTAYHKFDAWFFPITWREEDQISNAKMFSQSMTMLKLLGAYLINKKKFISAEHRDIIRDEYSADVMS